MKLTTTKFLLLVTFILCFVTLKAVAWDDDCEDEWEEENEDWDDEEEDCDDNDWDDDRWDHDRWDNDRDHDHWENPSATWYPVPTYGQSTGIYPTGVPVTITATYTQVYTATGVPTYTNNPQTGDAR